MLAISKRDSQFGFRPVLLFLSLTLIFAIVINNSIIFTRDNWETAATALGKTEYGYGLVAEVLVGELILGEQISIGSSSERVTINDEGILIKNDNGDVVFTADSNGNLLLTGSVNATALQITKEVAKDAGLVVPEDVDEIASIIRQEFKVADGELKSTIEETYATKSSVSELTQTANKISATVSEIQGDYAPKESATTMFGYQLLADKFVLFNECGDVLVADSGGLSVTGKINASSGQIAGLEITSEALEGGVGDNKLILNSSQLFVGDDTKYMTFDSGAKLTIVGGDIEALSGSILCNDLQTNTLQLSDGRIGFIDSSAGGYIDLNYNFGASSSDVSMAATLSRINITPGGGESLKKDRYIITVDKVLLKTMSFTINILESLNTNSSVRTRTKTITIAAGQKEGLIDYSTGWTDRGYNFAATGTRTYTFTQTNNAEGENIAFYGSLCPAEPSKFNLGSKTYMWNTVYAMTPTIEYSDANEKMDIRRLSDIYESVFDALEPVTYKFKKSDSGRTHMGLIAQQIKAVLDKYGIDTKDFAAYCEWEKADGQTGCGIRYAEFIPLCIAEIQKIKKIIAELKYG